MKNNKNENKDKISSMEDFVNKKVITLNELIVGMWFGMASIATLEHFLPSSDIDAIRFLLISVIMIGMFWLIDIYYKK